MKFPKKLPDMQSGYGSNKLVLEAVYVIFGVSACAYLRSDLVGFAAFEPPQKIREKANRWRTCGQ